MRKLLKFMLFGIAVVIMAVSCVNKNNPMNQAKPVGVMPEAKLETTTHQVQVEEAINTSGYTYLRVTEDHKENWIAVSKQEVTIGKVYYYNNALEMTDFHSKELDRDFPVIYFIQDFRDTKKVPTMAGGAASPHGKLSVSETNDISVEPVEGGTTIADVFAKRKDFANKQITIRGQVVKVNNGIMGKNWVHIQDGTKSGDDFDLTITTQETVAIGEVVTFSGTLILEKDFGAGYFYDVIVEEGKLLE